MKRFHTSDDILYRYNFIKYPIEKEPTFTTQFMQLHASTGVTWQDIANEIHTLRKQHLLSSNPESILMTCMVDHPDLVVSLTLKGCIRMIKEQMNSNLLPEEYAWFEEVNKFAKEMVSIRDNEH